MPFSPFGSARADRLPTAAEALPGRAEPIATADRHHVNGRPLTGPWAPPLATAVFGLGCFWGAERRFWTLDGVWVTMVGYAGGLTPNPTYAEVCTGLTGHAEVVRVVYDPAKISYDGLLGIFFESHDPTQGYRQGADVGSQYRSAIYWSTERERQAAGAAREAYAGALAVAGHRAAITTEIAEMGRFYYAEADHQQYLSKHPDGYCGLGGTGVACPAPIPSAPATRGGTR